MTQPTDRPAPCLLDACARQCTTECREAINRAWTSLRGTQRAQPTDRHGIDQLRQQYATAVRDNVRVRLGPNALRLAEEGHPVMLNINEAEAAADAVLTVRDAEMERMKLLVAASSEDGQAVRMAAQYAERAIENGKRAERAEAARGAALALHERDLDADYCVVCSNHGDITWPCATVAVLDQHGQTPA